jgi:hypothetical protein
MSYIRLHYGSVGAGKTHDGIPWLRGEGARPCSSSGILCGSNRVRVRKWGTEIG